MDGFVTHDFTQTLESFTKLKTSKSFRCAAQLKGGGNKESVHATFDLVVVVP